MNINNGVSSEINSPKDTAFFGPNDDMNSYKQQDVSADEIVLTLEDFDHLRITKEKNIPSVKPIINLGGCPIAKPGNLTGVSAVGKGGKTAFTSVLIAGAISKTGVVDGFADVDVLPNVDGKAVLSFDTEQSEDDQQYNLNTILKRAGMQQTPEYYREYNLLMEDFKNYQRVVNEICERSNERFGGIHLIRIDGVVDFIRSVNDEDSAYNILEYFRSISIKYNCAVIVILHLNPTNSRTKSEDIKEAGHIGTILAKKCFALIRIVKKGEVSTIDAKYLRRASADDIPLIHFRYSKDKGYHIRVDAADFDVEDMAEKMKNEKLKTFAKKVCKPGSSYQHKILAQLICDESGKKISAAKNWLNDMLSLHFIDKGNDGLYRLNIENVG